MTLPKMTQPLPHTLNDWLTLLNASTSQNINNIDLSIDSMARLKRMQTALELQPKCTIITVGGTNGKGSTCAFLEAILMAAHYKVAVYSSPHIQHFCERLRIQGQNINETSLIAAFVAVYQAAESLKLRLTYFEFTTLACVYIVTQKIGLTDPIDVLILEVGMGGRLDACNLFDADCAIITSIDLDHQAYLGNTREAIAYEKAGIYRTNKIAICAEPKVPNSLKKYVQDQGIRVDYIKEHFYYENQEGQWALTMHLDDSGVAKKIGGLPHPNLRGMHQLSNASAAITALLHLPLAISHQDIKRGLVAVELPARFQILPGQPTVVLDVAHNPHACGVLLHNLDRMGFFQRNHAIFSVLADKDIAEMVRIMSGIVDEWHIAPLATPRALSVERMAQSIRAQQPNASIHVYPSIAHAYHHALQKAQKDARLIVFGSFHVIESVFDYQKNGLPEIAIKSYAKRAGRESKAQKLAKTLGNQHCIPFVVDKKLNEAALMQYFPQQQNLIFEIGFGMGHATAEIARTRADVNMIGAEVHTAGVGALLQRILQDDLRNIKIIEHDAIEVLKNMLPDASLNGLHIFFPDPWHKKKHHKRRIMQADHLALFVQKMAMGAYIHFASDWQEYADQVRELLAAHPQLQDCTHAHLNQYPRPSTNFERRGQRLGHAVYDLVFTKYR